MKGMIGRSGTSKRRSPACQTICCPSAGGVELLNVLAKAILLRGEEEAETRRWIARRTVSQRRAGLPCPGSPGPCYEPHQGGLGKPAANIPQLSFCRALE